MQKMQVALRNTQGHWHMARLAQRNTAHMPNSILPNTNNLDCLPQHRKVHMHAIVRQMQTAANYLNLLLQVA
jgi:hypothetical protein